MAVLYIIVYYYILLYGGNMSLEEYDKKRDFDRSPEPKGSVESRQGNIFVIQEHDASHLHWDLRLEIGGTLKSWAVPKTPPTERGLKRLAIQVEDHPIEYASFEGTIPDGNYGAGTVAIWDKGEFFLEEMSENKLSIVLKGKKMNGKYALIKVPNMGKNSWLFFRTG
jgi:DNA ligase D-like protein (predicted 3'-phosphoesterase)